MAWNLQCLLDPFTAPEAPCARSGPAPFRSDCWTSPRPSNTKRVKESVDISGFVDESEIDTRYFEKGYVLLRDTLAGLGKVGIARVVVRTREYLCMNTSSPHMTRG